MPKRTDHRVPQAGRRPGRQVAIGYARAGPDRYRRSGSFPPGAQLSPHRLRGRGLAGHVVIYADGRRLTWESRHQRAGLRQHAQPVLRERSGVGDRSGNKHRDHRPGDRAGNTLGAGRFRAECARRSPPSERALRRDRRLGGRGEAALPSMADGAREAVPIFFGQSHAETIAVSPPRHRRRVSMAWSSSSRGHAGVALCATW